MESGRIPTAMSPTLNFTILVITEGNRFGVLAQKETVTGEERSLACEYFYLSDDSGLPTPPMVSSTIGHRQPLPDLALLEELMTELLKHARHLVDSLDLRTPREITTEFGELVNYVFAPQQKRCYQSSFRQFFGTAKIFKKGVLRKEQGEPYVTAQCVFHLWPSNSPHLKSFLDEYAQRAGAPHAQVQNALRQAALHELSICLHGGDYADLELVEVGKPDALAIDVAARSAGVPASPVLARQLVQFPLDRLLVPERGCLISGPSGSGKTTALRRLQCRLLDQAGWLALYCEASRLSDLRSRRWEAVLDLLAEELSDTVDQTTARGVLAAAAADRHLVLLIDRLEAVTTSSDVGTLSSREMHKLTAHVRVIVAGRDEEVQWVAHDDAFTLLRLLPFSPTTSQSFFQGRYPEAQVLVGINSDLLTHPMHAYLVRELLQVGRGEPISSRGALYRRIIDHWLSEHNRDDVRALRPSQIGQALRELGRIAWEGLRKKQPLIERIPSPFWTARTSIGHMELLQSRGLIDLVHPGKTSVGHDLVFSHRSFQEWHAAQWVWHKSEWRGLVRDEYWNPQWHDLIRFLASERGDDVINELYPGSDSDDALYSRLFLAAECVGEGRASSALARRIESDLKVTTTKPAFRRLSIPALVRMGTVEAREYVWNLLMQTSTRLNTLFLLTTDDLRRLYTPDHLSWALRNRKGDGACLANDALTCWAAHIPQKALSRLVRQLHVGNELERLLVADICVAAASRLESTDIEWLRRAQSCVTPSLRAAHAETVEMLQGYLTPDDTVRLGLSDSPPLTKGGPDPFPEALHRMIQRLSAIGGDEASKAVCDRIAAASAEVYAALPPRGEEIITPMFDQLVFPCIGGTWESFDRELLIGTGRRLDREAVALVMLGLKDLDLRYPCLVLAAGASSQLGPHGRHKLLNMITAAPANVRPQLILGCFGALRESLRQADVDSALALLTREHMSSVVLGLADVANAWGEERIARVIDAIVSEPLSYRGWSRRLQAFAPFLSRKQQQRLIACIARAKSEYDVLTCLLDPYTLHSGDLASLVRLLGANDEYMAESVRRKLAEVRALGRWIPKSEADANQNHHAS